MNERFKKVWAALAAAWLSVSLAACGSQTQEALPVSYDSRSHGKTVTIKDQGSLGTCWAFASLKALELSLMPEETLEFSADHMTMHNGSNLPQEAGGDYTMSMAYLLSWQGPVLEEKDPYGDGYSPEGLMADKHVLEIQLLPRKDYEAIKRAVRQYGGVQSSLYVDRLDQPREGASYNAAAGAYYYSGTAQANHDSVIIGWDDGYSRENFSELPPGDGAFLCAGSWGTGFGNQGCFYVSYYDSNIGIHNLVYTKTEDPDPACQIYQSDLSGWQGQIGYGTDTVWCGQCFQAQGSQVLEAAGFYATDRDTEYELYVARHLENRKAGDLKERQQVGAGKLDYAGYYTISLDDKIQLEDGEKFAIIIKIKTPGAVHPAAIEYDTGEGLARIDLTDGEGYLSYDGNIWEHAEETHQCNLCVKAYTRQ